MILEIFLQKKTNLKKTKRECFVYFKYVRTWKLYYLSEIINLILAVLQRFSKHETFLYLKELKESKMQKKNDGRKK